MLTPAYELQFGQRVINTTTEPQASTVVALTVACDLDTPADSVTLELGQVGSFRPALEERLTVALGYAGDDALTQVFSGALVAVTPGLLTLRAVGLSPIHRLLHHFADETFEDRRAGEIVRALADRAGVAVAEIEEGSAFPAYVIDGRRSFYAHLRELATLCGCELYTNPAGELVFQRFAGGRTIHTFTYGEQVLALQLWEAPSAAASVEAWGQGPGRSGEAWAWLTKDFGDLKGSAGSGEPRALLERPALRTAAAAQTAAEAAQRRFRQRTLRGRLRVPGAPRVCLGDAVRLEALPTAPHNATYQVRSVTHRLTKAGGFVTEIGFEKIIMDQTS